MIDLHTHMIWGWDDGPDDWSQSLSMLRVAAKDGVSAVCLTPHVYRLDRHRGDLSVLRTRMGEFQRAAAAFGVSMELHWGAEVSVYAEVIEAIEKYRFTIDATNYVFIEFPATSVPPGSNTLVYNLMSKGFVPIISHPERNTEFAARPELLHELVAMGCAAQVTAMSLTGEFGRDARRAAGLFLFHNLVHFIASDAHGAVLRPPVLSRAVEAAGRIVGPDKAWAMVTEIPRAILDNQALPDWGEPTNPLRRSSWTRRLGRPWGKGRTTRSGIGVGPRWRRKRGIAIGAGARVGVGPGFPRPAGVGPAKA